MTKEAGKVKVVVMTGKDADNLQALYTAVRNVLLKARYLIEGSPELKALSDAEDNAPEIKEVVR